ncbi:hypothetical protein ACU61A_36295 [Pseudonocardia sichuanensis]
MSVPRWILLGLGAVLVVAGVLELVGDGPVWIYVVHLVLGMGALAVAWWGGWVKPAALVIGLVFLVLYVVEAASPDVVGDSPDPSSNASLIFTGVVLLGVLVALMTPSGASRR